MWAMLSGVAAGNPDKFTTKVTVTGPVKLPAASLGPSNVIVASPLPPASALVMGGTSFAVKSVAVNVGLVGVVVVGDVDDLEQPAARTATAMANVNKRLILTLLRRTCA